TRRDGAVVYSPGGQTIAIVTARHTGDPAKPARAVGLYDAATGSPLWAHSMNDWVSSVAFAADGKTLACTSGLTVALLDVATGAQRAALEPPAGYVKVVAFAPDGSTVAGVGSDSLQDFGSYGGGRLIFWDARDGSVLRTLDAPTGYSQ